MALILVIDDEACHINTVKRMLRKNTSHHAIITTDPREALIYIMEKPIALAIVDMRMPKMNGQELIQQAKQHKPDLKTILLTSEIVADSQADAFMPKPWDNGDLLAKINELLNQ